MLFFRSEEHRQGWAQFAPEVAEGHIPLSELVKLFSGDYFKRRLDPDYMSHIREYESGFINDLRQIKEAGRFWNLQANADE